jgi:hypothetical protein
MNEKRVVNHCGTLAALLALCVIPAAGMTQERKVPDTYTAVTVNMSPADVELKADILDWSTDEDRAAVIAAINDADDPVAALQELPTLGVVWRSGSAVGYAIKYARRETAPDGSETITLVTDKRVGSTSFNPWVADDPAIESPPGYSVIELNTAGGGSGSMSLAAAVLVDESANTIGLDLSRGTPVLADVKKAPRPYWARAD